MLELLADQVESLCGYKPDMDTVSDFLKSSVKIDSSVPPIATVRPQPLQPPEVPPVTFAKIAFSLLGQWFPARNARDVLIQIFSKLSERDQTFLDRFASLPRHGRKRRYLARKAEELYPNRPDLVQDHSIEFKDGWWLGVNLSKNSIERIIKMACEVSKLTYGTEITVCLGD